MFKNYGRNVRNSSTTDPVLARLLGGGDTSDRDVTFTVFPDVKAKRKREETWSLGRLERELKATTAPTKDDLPLFTGVIFGDRKDPDSGSLRTNGNAEAMAAIVVDYDGGEITPKEAAETCWGADLQALVASTPSHGLPGKGNRWRAIFMLSKTMSLDDHGAFVARANGLFRGTLDPASFTVSQSFYLGGVGRIETYLADGRRYLDEADDLDAGAIGRPRPRGTGKGGTEEKTGYSLDEFRSAVLAIPNDDKPYDEWLAIVMAIHDETDGSDEGIELAGEWSARSAKYDSGDLERRWDSFGRNGGVRKTGRSIIREARKLGWEDPRIQDAVDDMPEISAEVIALDGGRNFALDENGVIDAFTDRHGGELKFDHHAGRWFKFDGYWRREETKLAHHYARETSIELAKRDAAAKPLRKVAVWEAIERGARSVREFAVTSDVWNRNAMLLGTPGGVVDLRSGNFRPGRPEDFISRITAVAPIPLDRFRPERDCSRWLTFLDQALDCDAGAIRFLQQWGGYSLSGETGEQVLVFVYGPGGSGKGTAINTIGDILGDYAVNVGMETLTASKHDRHTTELARLRGARMARASETEKGRAWAENRIKTLTGQDTVTARFMRQDDFEFRPECKFTIIGNNRPSLKDVDSAIKRRFIVLPFDHPPDRKDADLSEKLKAEWPGILSWLIIGCLDWQKHGLVRPGVVKDATNAYFDEQDVFKHWPDECCEVGSGMVDRTDDLWSSWHGYASELGEDTGSRNRTFPETLSQRGFEPIRDTRGIRGRGFAGVRVYRDMRRSR